MGERQGLTLYPHAWVPYHMSLTNQLSINQGTILLYSTLDHTMTQ